MRLEKTKMGWVREVRVRECTICKQERSPFIMNNKAVCFRCDELLFDIEIECEEERPIVETPKEKGAIVIQLASPAVKKDKI